MSFLTPKSMMLEAIALQDQLADNQAVDRATVQNTRVEITKFSKALRDTIQRCLESAEAFETELVDRCDRLEARMVEREAQMRDGAPLAQDEMRAHGARHTGTEG